MLRLEPGCSPNPFAASCPDAERQGRVGFRPAFAPESEEGESQVTRVHLTERFDDALVYASRLHRHQRRKGNDVPYLSHLLAVTALVIENGGDEEQAIGALLHDAAEDQGGLEELARIEARFGPGVAAIVHDCSDSLTEPKPPWRPRKQAFLDGLAAKPGRSLLVSLADKTHNAECIKADYRLLGDRLWTRFSSDGAGVRWYYRGLSERFQAVMPSPLAQRLKDAVEAFAGPAC